MASSFDDAKRSIVSIGSRSSSRNLDGMIADFDYYLSQLDEIEERSVKVKKTSDPDQMLAVTCVATTSVGDALRAVEDAWLKDLRYEFAEAHDTRLLPDGVGEMRFITQTDGGPYVSGAVRITDKSLSADQRASSWYGLEAALDATRVLISHSAGPAASPAGILSAWVRTTTLGSS